MAETDNNPQNSEAQYRSVMVCQHQSCLRNGSAEVLQAFREHKISGVIASGTGCMGQCSSGPTVRVTPDEIWYCRVKPSDVPLIVEEHLKEGKPVEALFNPRIHARYYY